MTRIIYCVAQSVYKVRRSDKNLSPCVSFLDDLWFQVIDSQSNFVFGLNGNDTFILGPSAVDAVMHIIRVIEMMNAHITIMMYAELPFQRLPPIRPRPGTSVAEYNHQNNVQGLIISPYNIWIWKFIAMIKCWRRDGVNYLQPLLTSLTLGRS